MKKWLFGIGAAWLVVLLMMGAFTPTATWNSAVNPRIIGLIGMPAALAAGATPTFTPVLFRSRPTATHTPKLGVSP